MVTRAHMDSILKKLAQEAAGEIAVAVQATATEFISSGGYGSVRMHKVTTERIVETFRASASLMVKEGRHCYNPAVARELIEHRLSSLMDHALEQRAEHLRATNFAPEERELFCDHLRRDLKRLKDATVRQLATQ